MQATMNVLRKPHLLHGMVTSEPSFLCDGAAEALQRAVFRLAPYRNTTYPRPRLESSLFSQGYPRSSVDAASSPLPSHSLEASAILEMDRWEANRPSSSKSMDRDTRARVVSTVDRDPYRT